MEITKEPNKILRQKMSLVKELSPDVAALISEMRKAMQEHHGVGLAANQVGKDLRIFVIDEKLAREHKVPSAYINPEITDYSNDRIEAEEGCLSLPESWRPISRAKKIKIKFTDEAGRKKKIKARGFLARVLQHETDHLNGILIGDLVK